MYLHYKQSSCEYLVLKKMGFVIYKFLLIISR